MSRSLILDVSKKTQKTNPLGQVDSIISLCFPVESLKSFFVVPLQEDEVHPQLVALNSQFLISPLIFLVPSSETQCLHHLQAQPTLQRPPHCNSTQFSINREISV